MRRLQTPAVKRSILLPVALAALAAGGSPAIAQSADPFALPTDVTINNARQLEASGPGLSEIKVDGRTLARMVELAYLDGELAIDAKSAQMANLPVPAGTSGMVKLKDIKIADWQFDKLTQRLTIKLFRDGDGANDINFSRFAGGKGDRSPLPALLIDYNLSATVSGSGTQAGAVVSPRFSYGNMQLAGALQYTSTPETGLSKIRRLDTTFSFAMPEKGLIARAGDTITAGSQSQRPLRIGGLQIGTDFALRPDLVTNPLPAFEGNVAVPTGLDLIVNDRRFSSSELEAGRFQIRNIPVSPGRGEVSVIVKDELGREVVQSARIYVSRDLLAPGLWEGAANVGYIRRRYGQVSNDYRDLVSTFFLRRGFSESLSFGLSGEAGLGVKNFGAQLETTLFDRALAFSEVRYSNSGENSGFLVRGGVESSGKGLSLRAEAVWPTSGYRDLASEAGDPLPARQFNTSISFDLKNTIQVQLTASHQKRAFDANFPQQTRQVDILRGSLRTRLSDRIDLYAEGSYTKSDRTNLAFMVGINVQLGKKRSGQVSVSHNGGDTSGQASFFRPDVEPGDIGYGAEALLGEQTRLGGRLAWRTRHTRLEGQAEYNDGSLAARANARGTLIFAGNTFYARNQTGGSYALVQTGKVGGIAVTRENRDAGVTDSKGRLLVENITPLVPVQFDLDPDKLPYDAVARSTYRRISVSRGGVALVNLEVEAYRSQLIKLVDYYNKPVAVGTLVKAEPSGTEYTVAFDGLFDLNALSGDKRLVIERAGGGTCAVRIPNLAEESFEIPEIKAECIGLNIAQAGPLP